MRAKMILIMLLCGVMLALVACGGAVIEERGRSGFATKNETESVKEEQIANPPIFLNEKYDYCNKKYIMIPASLTFGYKKLQQYRLDGTLVKEYEIAGFSELVIVEDDWVYYVGNTKKGDTLYRIPFAEDNEEGEKLLDIDRQEKILCDEADFLNMYLVGNYFWYEDSNAITVEYSIKKKDYTNSFGHLMHWDGASLYARCGDWVFFDGAEENTEYQANSLTGEYKKINVQFGEEDIYCDGETALYWAPIEEKTIKNGRIQRTHYKRDLEEGVYRHDIETAETSLVASAEELSRIIVKKNELGITKEMLDSAEVVTMQYDSGHIYVQVQIGWHKGEDYYYNYVVLSGKNERGAELRYEKELNREILGDAQMVKRKWKNNPYVKGGICDLYENANCLAGVIEGNFLLGDCVIEKECCAVKYYEPATGEVKKLSEADGEMFYLWCDSEVCDTHLLSYIDMERYPENADITDGEGEVVMYDSEPAETD